MAIGVKVLKRPERDVSYVRATLKGMALTFKHMFEPKVTMQYPEEKSTGPTMAWAVEHLRPVARHAPHAHRRAGPLQVRRLRALPADLPRQLHQARAGRGRGGQPLPARSTRSTSSAASSAATARKSAPRRRSTSACTTRTRSTRATGSSTTSSGSRRRPIRSRRCGTPPIPGRVDDRTPCSGSSRPSARHLGGAVHPPAQSPVRAALWLVSTMFSLAAIYVLLDAQFIAAIQVLVYAGAVMVLFLFVIMLLNLGHTDVRHAGAVGRGGHGRHRRPARGRADRPLALHAPASGRGAGPGRAFQRPARGVRRGRRSRASEAQRAAWSGPSRRRSSRPYLVPFEITSILLLAAIVGAVVLAKRKI